ncbi:bacteriocin-like protein [Chryseobacterium carnipullorum]
MKNYKKISRDQLKSINGGALSCSEACCPPSGIKRCPWVICIVACEVLS